ncbi:hypothetical protein G7Y79_00006g017920 [Physcia stellaris]|nr:hypothetical protein G7Y79_00006g017920 [Physcia stellaris]
MAIIQSMKLISLSLLYSLSVSHAKPILPRDANSTAIAFQLTAAHSGPDDRTLCPPGNVTEFLGKPGLGEIALRAEHRRPRRPTSLRRAQRSLKLHARSLRHHSPGSSYGPFNITLDPDPDRASGFRYAGPGARVSGDDFYACSKGGKEHGPYQVFVNRKGLRDGDVLGVFGGVYWVWGAGF